MHIYVYIGDKTQIKWTMSQLTSTITEYNICIRCYVHMLHDNLTYHHVKSATVHRQPSTFSLCLESCLESKIYPKS